MRKRALAYALLAASTIRIAAAAEPFKPEDNWLWREPDDPRISPDGKSVVYVEKWSDRTRDANFSNLWIASIKGSHRRQWTEGLWRDTSPRWSPDGTRLAWISDRSGVPQIFVQPIDKGEAKPITSLDSAPQNLVWSPDGAWIGFVARVPAEPATPKWAPPAILPFLRLDMGGYRQIFVIAAEGGSLRRITRGNFDCLDGPAWMPDGRSVLAGREGEISAFRIDDGTARVLVKGNGRYLNVSPSPDGGRIAYLFAESKPQSYVVQRLFVSNADGSRPRELAGTLDRDPAHPQWSSDSRTIYFLADDSGVTRVYAARNNGAVRQVQRLPERLRGFSLAGNGTAVSVRSTNSAGVEIVAFTVDVDSEPATLASPNRALLNGREIGAAEEIRYSSGIQTIQAWIVKPPRFDAAKKYPLVVDVVDNPRAMCGVEFRLRAQIFAARGFVVLCANPRGTPGFGEQFGHLLRTRYPGDDFEDLMRGVDYMLSKGYVDSGRLAITGSLVAAWAIGHTDRFHRAVARRPISDFAMHVATHPDGALRARQWMGAMPWEDADQHVKHSPLYFALNFKTPTLVLAGDPDVESDALYFALQERKVESALVRLPGASKPSNQVLEMEAILAWISQ